jgi:glycosyltransferase involved in cell wall biosynthesis
MTKRQLIIEGGSLAEKNMSGVGHTTLRLVQAMADDKEFVREYDISIIVPFNKMQFIHAHRLPRHIKIKRLFLPGKVMNGLVRMRIVPYMDIFFGKGTYLFPNFKNWPLLFSKNITYIHDVYFRVAPEHIESRNLSMLERNINTFIRRASLVIGVSKHAKAEIERFFPKARGKTEFVYDGVDTSFFYKRSITEQNRVAKKYGLTPGGYFLFFSNIEPRKNVLALLNAYKQYCNQKGDKDTALILVGGMGWGNEQILAEIESLQKSDYKIIKPKHYVPDEDMPALISGSKALVHPAVYEGFGLTPLEAMACGTPIIVGSNSSLPEVVGEAYDYYIDITDPEKIANAMMTIEEYPERLIKEGLKRAAEFSWSKSAEKLVSLIRSL